MIYLQYVIDSIGAGMQYALVALGIGLVFGVMRLANFAHGELLTAGGYTLYETRDLPAVVRVLAAVAVMVLLALAMERFAFRRLRDASPATMLVMTFAVSFLLRAIAQKRYTQQAKPMQLFTELNKVFSVGSLKIRWSTPLSIVVGGALLVGVNLLLTRTELGLQMRAAAVDFRVAQAIGVRANRVIVAAFVLAALLGSVALVLIGTQRSVVVPEYGLQIVIVALVGVVVGGMDRLVPATLGGFAVGFAFTMLSSLLPSAQRVFLDSAVYGLVVLVLLVRPGGVFLRQRVVSRL